jgi:hypothetical protein
VIDDIRQLGMIAAVSLRWPYLIWECRCGAPGRRTARLGAGDAMPANWG